MSIMKSKSLELFKNAELLPIAAGTLLILAILAGFYFFLEKKNRKPGRRETFLLSAIVLIYSLISFTRLGSLKMPSTTWQPVKTPQSTIFELTGDTYFNEILVFYGEGDNNSNPSNYQLGLNDLIVYGSDDQKNWEQLTLLSGGSIFRYVPFYGDWDYRYIRLVSQNGNDTISEIAFMDEFSGRILPVRIIEDEGASSRYPASFMIDEQDQIPGDITFYDESYFDEIYHPRNAWEIANGQFMYPTVHPLLGTEMIALSILLFGNNPFAWRLPGALFGSAMLVLFYCLLCELTDRKRLALTGTFLLACDFMHVTTSRIGTLEPMSVFFILLMFHFMIRYARTSFYQVPFEKTLLILLACGISTGLGIAVKWTACYSAVGLAIILFHTLYRRWKEYQTWNQSEEKKESTVARFPEYFTKTILWCFVCFIAIPVVIYFLVYLPAPFARDGWSIDNVIRLTMSIYRYHINLDATHPFQSVWYQWILDIRPIWYYSHFGTDGIYYTISCFSNPLLCLAGIPAILYTLHEAIRHRNLAAFIIFVGYITALLPWVLVQRCVFAYHFYPTSMFMIMAIAWSMERLRDQIPSIGRFLDLFLILVLVVFIIYLPVTCGFGTTHEYAKALEIIPSWTFS